MSANNHNCLNCGTPLTGKYCNNCGQKADTHRISTRHFVMHDLLHGALHIEKGLFFTILQVFKHRGRTALDYIAGQRIRYYNVFYLSLILLSLNILAVFYKHKLHPDTIIKRSGSVSSLYEFTAVNIKFIILTFIPLMALNMLLLFRRKKHNYAEHMVAAGFCMVGILSLALFTNIVTLFANYDFEIWGYVSMFFGLLVFFFPLFFYYSYARPHYKLWGYSWRILIFYMLFLIELIVLTFLLTFLLVGEVEIEGELRLM
jgi:hypothetical protein